MSDNNDFRSRLSRSRDRDRDQIEGFFESRRGQVFAVVAVALFALAFLWGTVSLLFGAGQ